MIGPFLSDASAKDIWRLESPLGTGRQADSDQIKFSNIIVINRKRHPISVDYENADCFTQPCYNTLLFSDGL